VERAKAGRLRAAVLYLVALDMTSKSIMALEAGKLDGETPVPESAITFLTCPALAQNSLNERSPLDKSSAILSLLVTIQDPYPL
jgi:hypothetical protein